MNIEFDAIDAFADHIRQTLGDRRWARDHGTPVSTEADIALAVDAMWPIVRDGWIAQLREIATKAMPGRACECFAAFVAPEAGKSPEAP